MQRDSERDYAMLYEDKSPTRPTWSSTNPPEEERIPEYELKPEVIAAADVLDQPGRITRPHNVSLLITFHCIVLLVSKVNFVLYLCLLCRILHI